MPAAAEKRKRNHGNSEERERSRFRNSGNAGDDLGRRGPNVELRRRDGGDGGVCGHARQIDDENTFMEYVWVVSDDGVIGIMIVSSAAP